MGAMQHFAGATTAATLNISDASFDKREFNIFPNPAKDVINLELNSTVKNFTFEVTDMSGKLLSSSQNNKVINISTLKKGIYIGTLSVKNQKSSKKFIVK